MFVKWSDPFCVHRLNSVFIFHTRCIIGAGATEQTVQSEKVFPTKDKRADNMEIQDTTISILNTCSLSENGTKTLLYKEEESDPEIDKRVVATETGTNARDTTSTQVIHYVMPEDTIISKRRGGREQLVFIKLCYRTGRYYRVWLTYKFQDVPIDYLQPVLHPTNGPLLLQTPDPVQFETSICSNVEVSLSKTCHMSAFGVSNSHWYYYFNLYMCKFYFVYVQIYLYT